MEKHLKENKQNTVVRTVVVKLGRKQKKELSVAEKGKKSYWNVMFTNKQNQENMII